MTDKQIIIYKKECYNEPHCSLNQVLEQLNAYKMEADEGKEINAELKAENDELKNKIFRYEELLKHSAMAQNTYTAEEVNTIASGIKFVGNSLIAEENNKLHKTLTEIKEISNRIYSEVITKNWQSLLAKQILQKISEVENV